MKIFHLMLCTILLAGCTGAQKKGMSYYDDYDAVKVDQMVGNSVSGAAFQKTIVCLNARRETRRVSAVTNVTVMMVTNQIVNAITNQTVSIATNYLFTTMTNLAPLSPGVHAASPTDEAAVAAVAAAETNTVVVVTNAGPAVTTNLTVSIASNQSATTAPNQAAANSQVIRTYNNQITTASNNLIVSLMTNLVVTAETNQVVSYVTNYSVATITNLLITPTNFLTRDYFIYTEMIPPADFNLQGGESLVLLVDGVRLGLVQTPSSSFVGRKRFTSGLYRVPPEALVAIANAKDVKIRFKGANSTVERIMNDSSKQNFKNFLLKYFVEEPAPAPAKGKVASAPEAARVASY